MADFYIKFNGAVVDGPVLVKGDQFSSKAIMVEHKTGSAGAGKAVTLETSAPLFVSPVAGVLDATGKWTFVLGPSFGAKGDATITVKVANKKDSFEVRFTD